MNNNLINDLNLLLTKFSSKKNNLFLTSSFQTQSVPLLHFVSQNFKDIKVVFIDTGFLFAETYYFKNELTKKFNLNLVTVNSKHNYVQQLTSKGMFLFTNDTDKCCSINKVEPLNNLLNKGDIWISGVRRDQTAIRMKMKEIEIDTQGVIRVHPMLNWTSSDIYQYLEYFQLPKHPLDNKGYGSIGCVPCTHKIDNLTRDGRWVGSTKTECGLHINTKKS